ncbi:hypothetical protein [Pedobacter boryungensis]|uniref:Uncharacterized protein n=1 Tax=Pedobacter boryungensis TaxID=869962 RepID=A0ABX2DHZ3_9SPHI|nr:hypothetical protein [Pedobacter boryungensis]NQX33159.1 hypothetical protein [Pedobacter boryungensis]
MKYLNRKICLLTAVALVTGMLKSNAQIRTNLNLSNDGAPASTAFLDASSSVVWNSSSNNLGKGLVFPRTDLTKLSNLAMTGFSLPSNFPNYMDGMMVYNVGSGVTPIGNVLVAPGFYYYKNSSNTLLGGTWMPVSGGSNGSSDWSIFGNANINPATNFLGTTGPDPLIFKVNKIIAATFSPNGSLPSSLNIEAPLLMNGETMLWNGGIPGQLNLMVGTTKTKTLSGQNNTLIGGNTGLNLAATSFNTFVGAGAGSENTTGIGNTFIGDGAGLLNQNGHSNIAIGKNAGPIGVLNNTVALGYGATVKADNSMVLGGINAYRVNVGINTEAPRSSLDVATDDAIVLPVGPTTKQPGSVGSPLNAVPGMIRFNSESNFLEYRNNSKWVSVGFGPGWNLTGNAGTIPTANYIGTADNQPTVFSANATEAFRIEPNGTNPGNVNLKAPLFVNGQRMLWDGGTPSKNNIVIGNTIPSGLSGTDNIFMGKNAGATTTDGEANIFIGEGAGIANTIGARNTAIGTQAGPSVGNLSNTVALGYKAKVDINNAVVIGSATDPVSVGINISSPRAAFDISDKGAMIVPTGSEGQRPKQPVAGMVRYNQTSSMLEYYNGTEWISLSDYKTVLKGTYDSPGQLMAPGFWHVTDIPVPGAKIGGVVNVSLSKGLSPFIINLPSTVTQDGIVTVQFYSLPVPENTVNPQSMVVGGGPFQIFVSVIQ